MYVQVFMLLYNDLMMDLHLGSKPDAKEQTAAKEWVLCVAVHIGVRLIGLYLILFPWRPHRKKILSTPSFGGEVKPSVSCRRFAACKISLNLRGSRNLGKIIGQIYRPQFHLSLLGSLASLRTYRHLAAKVGTSKGGGKQWQTTPKNLPRTQCARAIPVAWLGSCSCQRSL